MKENLLAGKKIELGDLGEFFITLNSVGVDNAEDYNPSLHVKSVNVNWTPGENFLNLLDEATFNVVPDRKSAKALAKAIKAGAKTVTIGGDNDGNQPSGGSSAGGNTGAEGGGGSSSDGGSTVDPRDTDPNKVNLD
mgnify:CR=1 FL=1